MRKGEQEQGYDIGEEIEIKIIFIQTFTKLK